jgi:hypothetical protein
LTIRGSVVTAFDRKQPAAALSECTRFYQTGFGYYGGPTVAGSIYESFDTYPVPMRVTPTLTAVDAGDTGFAVATPTLAAVDTRGIKGTKTATVTMDFGVFQFNFTASAEL